MKLRAPNYYKKFKCIADKCKDSCCSAGWEINIDERTANYYENVPGEFGDKLHENICNNSDGSSKCFKLDINNNCPFFNNQKLCEIYINLGEEHLCQICTDHPRYYEWFKNAKEAGIGLCCEEAARIILSQTEPFSTYEIEIPDEDCSEYDEELFLYLLNARNKIINLLNNSNSENFNSSIRSILEYCNRLQQNIDNYLSDDENFIEINNYSKADILKIMDFFLTLEPNDKNWLNYFKNCIHTYNSSAAKLSKYEKLHPEINNYLKNISIYFIWRYFLKGTFDEEIISKINLMAVSIAVLKILFFCKWIECGNITLSDCINIVKKYSEEIEYDENNIIKLADACYEIPEFNIENLIGLF